MDVLPMKKKKCCSLDIRGKVIKPASMINVGVLVPKVFMICIFVNTPLMLKGFEPTNAAIQIISF